MSIYSTNKVRQLAEEKMKKDLSEKGYDESNTDYFKSEEQYNSFYTLSDSEFSRYFLLTQIVPDMDKWSFYTEDNVYEEIILMDDELKHASDYLDTEELLETAKDINLIGGFMDLGGDLWMINDIW